jgi:molybdopterin molybdotransferase
MAAMIQLWQGPLSFNAAVGHIDAAVRRLPSVATALGDAYGRVLAEDIRAMTPIPPADLAAIDGFAVRAEASLGAGPYNPINLPLVMVSAGAALPAGTDAVIALDAAEPAGVGRVGVVEGVAPGDNVERRGSVASAGALLAAAGTRLAPRHLGLLALAGVEKVIAVRRPQVQILLAAPAAAPTADSDGPMLRAAVERDGGIVTAIAILPRSRSALGAALAAAKGDIVLLVGGTGPGPDDHAAAALADIGELAFHGVSLCPGDSVGFGHTGDGVLVMLVSAMPSTCLWSYELFAGRAVRRLGGHAPGLPYRTRELTMAKKLVSAIGMTEICPVLRTADGRIEPLPASAGIGLRAAALADGFVIIPEAREGYPPGAVVTAYFYDEIEESGGRS